jgi:hypothetical protein
MITSAIAIAVGALPPRAACNVRSHETHFDVPCAYSVEVHSPVLR